MMGIPRTKKFVTDLALSVGLLVVGFAQFEFSLNMAINLIYSDADGRNLVEPELPRNLGNRLKFMRKAAKKLPEVISFKDEILSLMAKARGIADKRDHIIHGYAADYDRGTKTLLFIKADPIRPTMTKHAIQRLSITFAALQRLGENALDLATAMGDLSLRLDKAIAPKHGTHDPLGTP